MKIEVTNNEVVTFDELVLFRKYRAYDDTIVIPMKTISKTVMGCILIDASASELDYFAITAMDMESYKLKKIHETVTITF